MERLDGPYDDSLDNGDHWQEGEAVEAEPLWQDEQLGGDLTPPSEDLQRRVETAYARRGLDEATVRLINHGFPQPGRTQNCAEIARSVALTLDGRPQAAGTLDPRLCGEPAQCLQQWAGVESFVFHEGPQGVAEVRDDIIASLRHEPHRSNGFLLVIWQDEQGRAAGGHVVNVVNDRTGELGHGPGVLVVDAQPDGVEQAEVVSRVEDYLAEPAIKEAAWRRYR